MHWPNLYDMSGLLALENSITTPSGHTRDIQKLRSVNHVIVYHQGSADGFSI
jgi:hypothetical protein